MKTLLISLGLILLFVACDNPPPLSSMHGPFPGIENTPMADGEAEMAAYSLSGELVAPTWLYNKIHHELILIRDQYGDLVFIVNERPVRVMDYIHYRPNTHTSRLNLGFDTTTFDSLVNNQYHAWDELNNGLRVKNIQTSRPFVMLEFEGRLNSNRLVDYYAGLPGLQFVYSEVYFGDGPYIIIAPDSSGDGPVLDDRTPLNYYFRLAWGDCMAGCAYSLLLYFTVINEKAEYHGYYFSYQETPMPNWQDEFLDAWLDYLYDVNYWAADSSELRRLPKQFGKIEEIK